MYSSLQYLLFFHHFIKGLSLLKGKIKKQGRILKKIIFYWNYENSRSRSVPYICIGAGSMSGSEHEIKVRIQKTAQKSIN